MGGSTGKVLGGSTAVLPPPPYEILGIFGSQNLKIDTARKKSYVGNIPNNIAFFGSMGANTNHI